MTKAFRNSFWDILASFWVIFASQNGAKMAPETDQKTRRKFDRFLIDFGLPNGCPNASQIGPEMIQRGAKNRLWSKMASGGDFGSFGGRFWVVLGSILGGFGVVFWLLGCISEVCSTIFLKFFRSLFWIVLGSLWGRFWLPCPPPFPPFWHPLGV